MATFPGMFWDIAQNVWRYSPECLRTFPRMFGDIPRNTWGHSPECLATFPGMFEDIPQNIWRHSPEYLRTFPRMFKDISQNVWEHSPECLATFLGMFEDIPRNIWGHSPECLRTFPRMFEDIPRNVWRHSPEYNIPPIPRVPRIQFPVLVFLVLYIAPHLVIFLFAYFNSNILYSVHLFCTQCFFAIDLFSNVLFQIFDYFWKDVSTKLLISLCWYILHQI